QSLPVILPQGKNLLHRRSRSGLNNALCTRRDRGGWFCRALIPVVQPNMNLFRRIPRQFKSYLTCAMAGRLAPPHLDPLPLGEGTALAAPCCSAPVGHIPRCGIPKTGEPCSLSLGHRAGVRGRQYSLSYGLICNCTSVGVLVA